MDDTSLTTESPVSASLTDPRSRTSDRFYRPELDVLRFFAFFVVFTHHALPPLEPSRHSGVMRLLELGINIVRGAGGFGMCLFFLLSAYLITELLQKERQRTGTIHVSSFYVRRILRIWPLYFGFLLAIAAVGVIYPPFRLEKGRIVAFLLLAANWYSGAFGYGASAVAPLWSISLEEQFYLLWPFVSKAGGRKGIGIACAVLFPLSFVTIYELVRSGATDVTIWVNSFVQFQFFALGALFALTLRGRAPRISTINRVTLFFGGIVCWLIGAAATLLNHLPAVVICSFGFAAAGCACIFASFLGSPALSRANGLVYLGKISYGLYVFHILSISVVGAVVLQVDHAEGEWTHWANTVAVFGVGLGLTILLASISYRFFEHPFLRLKERFTFIRSRSA
jgi:peptidoglycan/LPS O-acetylase OafA/YrhL